MNLIAEGVTIMITKLYLMPSQKCNCSCTYCYIPHYERDKQTEYTFLESVVNQFVKEIKENGLENGAEIRFIGGEPYLEFENMLRISNYFLEHIKSGKIVINSNGTLITEEKLNLFNINTINRIVHILSLDGLEEKHNGRRKLKSKENSFELTVNAIQKLQQLNRPVYLNMVLDEYTLDGLEAYMLFLKNQLKINELSVSLLFKPGENGNTMHKYELLEQVYKYAADYEILIGGHHRLLLGAKIPEFMCRAGEQTILLSGDQKIYACQRFVGREEAEIFSETLKFKDISCSACVGKNCYSKENKFLGEKLYELYKSKYSNYLTINKFDKILFGVL